jgi:uncharacterized membrane protein
MLARAIRTVFAFAVVVAIAADAAATAALSLGFFASNLLASRERQVVLAISLGAFVAAGAWGVVLIRRDTPAAVEALERWVRLACPALVAPLVLALLHPAFGTEAETALLLAALVVAFERLVRISVEAYGTGPPAPAALAPSRAARIWSRVRAAPGAFFARPRLVLALLGGLAAAHAAFIATWAIWSHQRFGTYGFDLGQYDNVFACTLHGRWLAMPALGLGGQNWGDITSNHADLAVFYLLGLYALKPGAVTLLVMQAVFVAGAAIPLYLFARSRLSPAVAFAVGLAWLLYAPLHGALLYDYHPQLIAVALVVCAIAAVEYRRYRLYWVFFVLAILCREDVSIGLAALGLYLLLSGSRVKTGLASVIAAAAYFVVMRFGIMGNGAFSNMYKDLIAPDAQAGFGAVLKTLISNPAYAAKTLVTWEKARYLAQIFAPLAFLPMRRPALWLLMIPGALLTVLSTGYPPMTQISFQYVANWAAYMFPASAIVLAEYASREDGKPALYAASAALVCGSIIACVQWGAYSPQGSVRGGFVDVPLQRPSEEDRKKERDVLGLLEKVPDTASMCVSDRLQPHTTTAHLENFPLKAGVGDCEYLLWLSGDMGGEHAQTSLANHSYELVEQRGSVLLAKKKPKIEAAAKPPGT